MDHPAGIRYIPRVRSTRVVLGMLLAASGAAGQYRRGVNVAGAEFGMSNIPGAPGRDYTFNSENTFQYFADKKLALMRVPLLWERLQPALRGPLDSAYLASLKGNVAWAKAHGGEIIIDVHNFARYSINQGGSLNTYVIDNPAPDGTTPVTAADP